MQIGPFARSKRFAALALSCLLCSATFVIADAGNASAQSSRRQPAAVVPQIDSATRADVAEAFAQRLADDYAYPDKGMAMAAAIRANLKSGAYNDVTSPLKFAAALERDARAVVDDRHLEVGFNPEPMRMRLMRHGPPSAGAPAQMRGQDATIPEVKILDGNIGYIVVNVMLPDPAAKDAIAAAFAFVHGSDALILDLRGNPGGFGAVNAEIMGYLSEGAPYLLDTVHWRDGRVVEARTIDLGNLSYGNEKPVFVLTSRRTFSAAEALAYDIQSFKRGVIVGETTGGGANPSTPGGAANLGHGFVARIPMGYVVNAATGTNWEGVGVKPDVEVPADDALAKAWSLALTRVSANAASPETRALLEALSTAKLGGPSTFLPAQLVGRYVSESGDATMVIIEKDGQLYGEERSNQGESAEIAFEHAGGDRYTPAGFPDGFSYTFAQKDGKLMLIQLQPPPRESSILEKQ